MPTTRSTSLPHLERFDIEQPYRYLVSFIGFRKGFFLFGEERWFGTHVIGRSHPIATERSIDEVEQYLAKIYGSKLRDIRVLAFSRFSDPF